MNLKRVGAAVSAAVLVLGVAGCSGGNGPSGQGGGSGTVIRTPIIADPPPLDPDVYYQPDGLLIMTATYEGLVKYENNSPELVGSLATEWEKSKDGLTYTFTLRPDVKFSDGTPFNAAAAKASFQRRIDMAAGPSYMLAEVADMQTPDDLTFVVKLKKPVAAFLDYLASPYGPLMTSPTAVEKNDVGDNASKWLGTHTAGTGPYELTAVEPSSKYVMTANEYYWGEKPQATTIEMPIVADPAVQRLQLEQGQLDMILHGLSKEDFEALSKNPETEVVQQKALMKMLVMVNPESDVFAPMEARAALNEALDREALTEAAFGDQGTVSTQFLPSGMLPDGAAPDSPELNPEKLTALGAAGGGDVVVGYQSGDNAVRAMTNQIQVVLQKAGFNATIRAIPAAQLFGLGDQPEQRPDLLVTIFNPDAAHPDTWERIYNYTNAPVNLLRCSVPEADKLLDAGSNEPDPEKSMELFAQASIAYRDSLCWINISDVSDAVAARKGYSGWQHQLPWQWNTDFASLTFDGQG